MEDHESSSSTGLIIGMIVGGVVVVLLLLGGVGAFFFMAHSHMEEAHVHAADQEALIKELVEEMREPVPPVAAVPEPRPEPAPRVDADVRTKLIGVWEEKALAGDPATLELRDDGSMELSALREGKKTTRIGRWELLEVKGNRAKLRRTNADNTDSVQEIMILGPDRFVSEGPGSAVYTRRLK